MTYTLPTATGDVRDTLRALSDEADRLSMIAEETGDVHDWTRSDDAWDALDDACAFAGVDSWLL